MARLHEFYTQTVMPELSKKFEYKSVMQIPRITKITLNMGVGEAVGDKKVLDHATGDMIKIGGQKPVVTKAKIITYVVKITQSPNFPGVSHNFMIAVVNGGGNPVAATQKFHNGVWTYTFQNLPTWSKASGSPS